MKCLSTEQIMLYLDQEMTEWETQQAETHLRDCFYCRKRVNETKQDFAFLEHTSDVPPLPLSFSDEVMKQLQPVKAKKSKGRFPYVKKAVYTAAGLTLALSLGTWVSPTFAEYVKTLFGNQVAVDEGVKVAAGKGFVLSPDQTVTDQGITLHVKEVFADGKRLSVIYELTDEQGNTLNPYLIAESPTNLSLTDEKGETISITQGWELQEPYGVYTFTFERQVPDVVNLHFAIHQIGEHEGSWKLDIPINLEKAKLAAQTYTLNGTFKDERLSLDLKQMEVAPSLTMLTLDVQDRKGNQPIGLHYTISDQKGNVIAAFDDEPDHDLNRSKHFLLNSSFTEFDESTNTARFHHAFLPFAQKDQLTFKLHGVYTSETTNVSVSFDPENLSKAQATENASGNRIQVKTFRLKTDTKPELVADDSVQINQKAAIVGIEGQLAKGITLLTDVHVKDEKGQELPAEVITKRNPNPDGTFHQQNWIIIYDVEQIPEKMSVTFGEQKTYTPYRWEKKLPLQ